MNNIVFATGSDLNYLNKIEPFLKSVNKNFNGKKILFYIEQDLPLKIDTIHNFNILNFKYEDFINKNKINCIQHGEFINHRYIQSLSEDTIVLFTDGDIIMQRPFSDNELDMLNLDNNQFLVGYNESENDTLLAESFRLNKISNIYDNLLKIDNWHNIPCYNTGVIAAKLSSWKKLFSIYTDKWNFIDNTFDHYAKQQWLICLILYEYFNVKIMPYSFHTHGHYKLPEGTHLNSNQDLCDKNGTIVLLRHKC